MRGGKGFVSALALMLAACSGAHKPASSVASSDLETAAIAAGILPDPDSTDLTGLYARETDRVCVVPQGDAYRMGVVIDYGDQQSCSGAGTVSRDGGNLRIVLAGADDCRFDARYEGDRIILPGRLPAGCQSLCIGRASLAGLQADRLSETASEASTLRSPRGKLLCGSE